MLNIIVNPNACRGKNKGLLQAVKDRLEQEGVPFAVYETHGTGDGREIARTLSLAGETLLIAMGGDGTLNEVLCGIVEPEKVTLGLIPAGTGNDFAAAANIPEGLAALDLILNGEAKYTDYLECNDGMRSINIAGLGIDVDILERCERMKGSDKSKYFRALLRSLISFRALKITITADGKTEEHRALLAAACNGVQFGGGIKICPPAVIDDGKMDLIVIDCPGRIKLPYYLVKLKKGKVLSLSPAHRILCEEAVIEPERKGRAQYDGELKGADALTAKIVHAKLKMFRG